ncbi:hypothetical protein [Sphingomonas sp.]|jgi:hypothetical protein|uniref:hypothetical protein n=1 Tax=Sphingomonas sp. TaxID=28214 RepID=UPI0035C7D3EE
MSGVEAAEARAIEARARLTNTVETLQAELAPEKLARAAVAEVTDGGARAAHASVAVARQHPAVLAGAGAVLLALLNRKRIRRLFTRRNR